VIDIRKILRVLRYGLIVAVALAAGPGALFGYFAYTPVSEVPHLSGALKHESIEMGGLTTTYLLYVPRGLARGAPLIVAMHGSGENGAQMRVETGFGFDRLADKNGFAVVYPNGYEGYWNGCNITGDYAANRLNIDDVKF
jgi:polyhydroxybutyrate depolymerase